MRVEIKVGDRIRVRWFRFQLSPTSAQGQGQEFEGVVEEFQPGHLPMVRLVLDNGNHMNVSLNSFVEKVNVEAEAYAKERVERLSAVIEEQTAEALKRSNVTLGAMKPLPDYGDHMVLQEFVEGCLCNGFTDDDGHGYYATSTQMSNIVAAPSEIARGKIDRNFTHVVWFNK